MATATLLVELVTEELPPKGLKRLSDAFALALVDGLRKRDFLRPHSGATTFATPRRLAVMITNVLAVAPDAEVTDKLMPAKVARDASGNISEALKRKLAALGRSHMATATLDASDGPDRVFVQSDGKADYVYLSSLAKGQPLQRGLEEALNDAIAHLPIAKFMSYASAGAYYNDQKFVRPAHRLVALHGADIVPVRALGLDAGRVTAGHRFAARADLSIATADAYEPTLEAEGKVVASFAKRRGEIVAALERASEHARVIMPDGLLDEVTALVESPAIYAASFDRDFLQVPQECLILTMQQNQKYFALADESGALRHRFLLVSNLAVDDPSAIVHGNERVLRARLADAKFFYDQDRKQSLASRVPKLAAVVYHQKLGSQLERVERIRSIARFVARGIGADEDAADRAALLAKADLVTDMVGEFPELQGIMGRYYALHDGENRTVADAIGAQYLLRQESEWANNLTGAVLMTADRTETLVGIFGIGLKPTGDKDPYGLRRAALGLIEAFDAFGAVASLTNKQLQLKLRPLLEFAASTFPGGKLSSTVALDLEDFIYERYRNQLALGMEREIVDAVVEIRPPLNEVPSRARAVKEFKQLPEAQSLASANKRITNILRKSGGEAAAAVDRSLLNDGAEHDLYSAVEKLLPVVHAHVRRGDYTEALRALASARGPVDRFFDDVLVMDDDRALRANRLALLRGLAEAMNQVADISRLAPDALR